MPCASPILSPTKNSPGAADFIGTPKTKNAHALLWHGHLYKTLGCYDGAEGSVISARRIIEKLIS